MKPRFEPRLPRMSSWKNIKLHTLDSTSGPLHQQQVFCHWTIKARYHMFPQINISSIQNYQLSFLLVTFTGLADLFPQLGSSDEQLCGDSMYLALMVPLKNTYFWCRGLGSNPGLWSLIFVHADILGRLGSNLVFIVPFGTSTMEFGTEVWLVPFGIMLSKSQLDRSIFRLYIPNCE